MTLEEKRTKMAVRLGWKKIGTPEYAGTILAEHWKNAKSGSMRCFRPKLDTDANTRKDILAVMTEAQENELIRLIWQTRRVEYKLSESLSSYMDWLPVFLLRLAQPDFFELAGQAMGLWSVE